MAVISEQDGPKKSIKIDGEHNALFEIEIPAHSQTWFVIK
jgi:hypothetical protein